MLWFLFLFIFILAGILSWERILPKRGNLETLLIGALWGMILSAVLPFFFALIFPFGRAVFASVVSAALIILACGRAGFKEWQTRFSQVPLRPIRFIGADALLLVFLVVLVPFFILFSRTFFVEEGAYFTGFRSAYGDVPFHLSYIASFAWGDNFPVENPDYAGTLADYPFLPYIPSAALVRLGADLETAFKAPAYILVFLAVALLIFAPRFITGDIVAAALVPLIFLLSGGLGFWWFFQAHGLDIFSKEPKLMSGIFDEATNIPLRGINLMNVLLSSLLPQRGVLFGLPIFLAMLILWARPLRRSIIASALLMAALPLLHPHTFITLGIVLPFFILANRKNIAWQTLAEFGAIIFVAAAPVLIFFRPDIAQSGRTFVRLMNGWMQGEDNFFWYWTKNLGVFLPVLFAAFFLKSVPTSLKRWYLPFIPIFFVANFIAFSPWEFDNHKLFNLWYLVSSFLVARVIADLFRGRNFLLKSFAVTLLVLTILSGAIEVSRLWKFSESGFILFGPAAREVGEFLRLNTPADAVFLDSSDHLSPIILSGRKRFMGYGGWLFAHGIDYRQRQIDTAAIYRGGPEAGELLRRQGISYVLVGPKELRDFGSNVFWFEERFEKIYDKDGYKVFRIQ